MPTVYAKMLPNFYQTDFDDLPESRELSIDSLKDWLRQDNKRGVIVMGAGSNDPDVAVWSGDEDGDGDDNYYTQPLPLEDPNDATHEGSAFDALLAAMVCAND